MRRGAVGLVVKVDLEARELDHEEYQAGTSPSAIGPPASSSLLDQLV